MFSCSPKFFNFLTSLPYIHSEQTISSSNGLIRIAYIFQEPNQYKLQVVTFMDRMIYNINFNWINSTCYGSQLLEIRL